LELFHAFVSGSDTNKNSSFLAYELYICAK
jgi:hypothetical protein